MGSFHSTFGGAAHPGGAVDEVYRLHHNSPVIRCFKTAALFLITRNQGRGLEGVSGPLPAGVGVVIHVPALLLDFGQNRLGCSMNIPVSISISQCLGALGSGDVGSAVLVHAIGGI